MSVVERRRRLIEVLKGIDPRIRTALTSGDSALLAYYGWGIMLNSAQEEAIRDIKAYPPGTIHVWRFANRTGKTTGLSLFHAECAWTKWRYVNTEQDHWLGYVYRTLHAAPLNVLAGKAWSMIESWVHGSSDQQRDPIAQRQRRGLFVNSGLFVPRQGKRADGSDALWVECATGSIIDMASTHDGAGRIEGESWWFLSWDEFPRQQPVDRVPDLIDQTFIPRSSDREAPVVLSGTAIAEADAVYDEIEEKARDSRWFNFKSFGRAANFSQTVRSIDRQREASFDKAAVHRSVEGGVGEGGHGTMLPLYAVRNAFFAPEDTASEYRRIEELPPLPLGRRWVPLMSVDHAIAKDRTAAHVIAAPWPPFDPNSPTERPYLFQHRIEGLALAVQRSSSSMTPDHMERFVDRVYKRYDPLVEVVDATGEGGQMMYRSLRAMGHRVRPCNYTERLVGQKVGNKEYGQSALAKMFGFGLVNDDGELGWEGLVDLPEPREGVPYGMFRFPRAGAGYLRLERQLRTLKVDDDKQQQDEAMTLVQLCWHLWPFYARGQRAKVSAADIRAPRGRRRWTRTRVHA